LTKNYENFPVVDNLSIEMLDSSFALLGPNGAGKTTTLLMLLGLIKPTSGSMFIFNLDVLNHSVIINEKIGYLPENLGYYSNITGREHLTLFCNVREYNHNIHEEVESSLNWCGINQRFWDKKVKIYSQGMLQRLGLAVAFIGNPKLVILDEPLSNIDPLGRIDIINKIKLKQNQGVNILISSHIIHDVEQIVGSICILNKGKLQLFGDVLDLAREFDFNEFEIRISQSYEEANTLKEVYDLMIGEKDLLLDKPILLDDKIIFKSNSMEEIKKVIPEFKNSNIRPLVGTLEKIYHKTMRC
ncbi:MAG: ABC transporter ATP-binding protein, partial [Candidatus Lokiarchaeota archaeon]